LSTSRSTAFVEKHRAEAALPATPRTAHRAPRLADGSTMDAANTASYIESGTALKPSPYTRHRPYAVLVLPERLFLDVIEPDIRRELPHDFVAQPEARFEFGDARLHTAVLDVVRGHVDFDPGLSDEPLGQQK